MTTTTSARPCCARPSQADLDAFAATSTDRRILEVDEDTDAYARGHIPGALAVHWQHDLQDPLRRDFIGPEAFATLMDRLGVGNDTQVVLYGGNSNWFAAYAYWYFTSTGTGRCVCSMAAAAPGSWRDAPSPPEVPQVAPSMGYRLAGPATEIRALRAQVLDAVGNGGAAALVDVRSPAEFNGEIMALPHLPQEGAQRRGHIPGAANIPWAKAVDPETGAFLPADQLRSLYEGKGLTPTRRSSPTAASASAQPTPGSSSTSCSATRRSATTTAWTEWGSLVGALIERGDR